MHGPADWLCHGVAERCFAPEGEPMALCARCVGMHVGFVVGVAAGRRGCGARFAWCLAVLGVVQMLVLGFAGRPDHAALRAASGLAFGAAVGWAATPFAAVGVIRPILTALVGAGAVVALACWPAPDAVAHALPVVGLGALLVAVAGRRRSPLGQ